MEITQREWLDRPVLICYDATALKKCNSPFEEKHYNEELHIQARRLYATIEEMRHSAARNRGMALPPYPYGIMTSYELPRNVEHSASQQL